MTNCKSTPTPVATISKLSASSGTLYADPTLYRALTGAVQYLTFTRHDISYVVQQVCLFMHDPKVEYMVSLHRILRYLKGTLDHGLQLYNLAFSLYSLIQILIGVVVLTLVAPPPVIVFFLGTISLLGPQNGNPPCLSLVLKQSIVVLLMLFLRHVGFVIYFLSCIVLL